MRLKLLILIIIISIKSSAQINTFILECDLNFDVLYQIEHDDTTSLEFSWIDNDSISINKEDLKKVLIQDKLNIKLVVDIINSKRGKRISYKNYSDVKLIENDKIKYSIKKKIIENNIIDLNKTVISNLFNSIKQQTKNICTEDVFSTTLEKKIQNLRKDILKAATSRINTFNNTNIIGNSKKGLWTEADKRNPIAFTEFKVRNPRTNGKDVITSKSNYSSYHYIKPGSIIMINFKKEIYDSLNNSKISIKAYLKRKNETVVPITVKGFYEVESDTNISSFEKNIVLENEKNEQTLEYNYKVLIINNTPIQVEVDSSMANPQVGDKLIIIVSNVSDGNVSFTTRFEYENFGWETYLSGGFTWVNTVGNGKINYRVAGTSSNMFHYKVNKGGRFMCKFLSPSFGPELVVLQDDNQKTVVGLGLSVSTFLRTVKVGYGWNLTGENGKPYFSIGVNFVEGYKSISSILGRSKE